MENDCFGAESPVEALWLSQAEVRVLSETARSLIIRARKPARGWTQIILPNASHQDVKSESAVSHERRMIAALVLTGALVIQIGIPSVALIYHGWERSLDLATGIMWQVDDATVRPSGNWQRLGAHRLIVQWTYTEGKSYLADDRLPLHPVLPDWSRIAKEPWAREVIVGLAGEFDENRARASTDSLAALSKDLSAIARNTGLNIVGWYFPVEVDPTWRGASRMGSVLADLPRPLWISVYDRGNIGPKPLADWLLTWLPPDIGVLFQDGVGTDARQARIARDYADELRARLGSDRFALIAEAFRTADTPGFRSATAAELIAQLSEYRGHTVYIFDAPHYLSSHVVNAIIAQDR
jgi:hypothetical protein